ncbi:apolipoprotein D-like [Amphibalanus amphitrite]|uniref:apolipoprotein D-like n=1 Tax=Amphibalanus amphitrite TaxID=1232801 RepID=UPI001C924A67|nr:apolipoprotein D-like [Amphibalanus amphitrite]
MASRSSVLPLLLAVLAGAVAVSAHRYGAGKCANVTPMDDFDASRMVGLWYVHRAFSTSSTCLTFNYTLTTTGLEVVETKELRALDAVGLDHKYSSVGTLKDNGLPGAYQASFSTNPLKSKYVIISTDYDNYAGVFHCQHWAKLVHRRNVYVLSRTRDIEEIYIEKIRRRMLVFDLEPEQLESVSHEACTDRADSDFDVRLDGSLFDLRDKE